MRPESAERWSEILKPYDRFHVCMADPGAYAIIGEITPLLQDAGKLVGRYVEGWAAAKEPGLPTVDALFALAKRGDAIILGSRTDYARTQHMLRQASEHDCRTIFVFDHWKNYSAHFGAGPLPDVIVVSDEIAHARALDAIGAAAELRLRIAPHLAIEAAADRIKAFGPIQVDGTIALLLDPTETVDGLGYDWRSTLTAAAGLAAGNPNLRLVVKPHPRQRVDAIADALAQMKAQGVEVELFQGDTERLIGMAAEVWGMTTVALNIALAANKPIRSFQIGRNEAGRAASNPHIEPYVLL